MTHDTPPKRIWATEDRENFGEDAFHSTSQFPGGAEYILASEADAMVAAALREAATLVAVDHVSDAILALADNHAAAALGRAILEAKSEIAALLGITTTRDTMTKEPVMWGDADGDCLTPEIAVQCALDKLIAEAVARGRIVGLEEARSTANLNAWCHKVTTRAVRAWMRVLATSRK